VAGGQQPDAEFPRGAWHFRCVLAASGLKEAQRVQPVSTPFSRCEPVIISGY
jgi:hypothetical protein